MNRRIVLLLAGVAAFTPRGEVIAQASSDNKAYIILKPKFISRSLGALIRRTPPPHAATIIALSEETVNPQLLFAAMKSLESSRKKHGAEIDVNTDIEIPRSLKPKPDVGSLRSTQLLLDALRTAAPISVPGVTGKFPAIVISLK